jgi:DNA (cytosine-5)-methyltransferase 1
MRNPIMLCGCMFDLHATDTDGETIYLHRKRLFELGGWDIPGLVKQSITIKGEEFAVRSPRECDHSHHRQVAGVYGGARRDKYEARMIRHGGYVPADKGVASALMGIVHAMSWEGLYEALPPSYTNYIGTELGKVVSS